jgi:hypothetical protein
MLFFPSVIGSAERAQCLQESCSAALKHSRKRLTAELANVLISIRRRSGGAEGESSKSSIDDFGFCRRQFASAPANQYSVLVIHVFLLSSFGSVERTQKLLKESLFGGDGKDAARNQSTAFVEIAVKGTGCSQAAFGRRPEPAAYLVDFLLVQVTSAPASQHSVLIIHGVFSFHHWVR